MAQVLGRVTLVRFQLITNFTFFFLFSVFELFRARFCRFLVFIKPSISPKGKFCFKFLSWACEVQFHLSVMFFVKGFWLRFSVELFFMALVRKVLSGL